MTQEICPILCQKCQEYLINRLGLCNRCLREQSVFYKQVQEDAQKYDQQHKQNKDKGL